MSLLVYCPECGAGPLWRDTQEIRGKRASWPLSTDESVFDVGTFTCPSCQLVLSIEVPADTHHVIPKGLNIG